MIELLRHLLHPFPIKSSILNLLEAIGPTLLYITLISSLFLIIYGCLPILKLYKSGYRHPVSIPFLGTTFWVMLNGYQKCHSDWNLKYGQVYAVAECQAIWLMVSDPELLKGLLVRSFSTFPNRWIFPLLSRFIQKSLIVKRDDEWRWARKLVLPAFTSSKMRHGMFGLISKCASVLVGHMKEELRIAKEGDPDHRVIEVEIISWFECLSMDVIASTAFGLDLDSHTDKNSEFVKNSRKVFEPDVVNPAFVTLSLFPFLLPFLTALKAEVIDPSCLQFFADIVNLTIDRRREYGIRRNDYLQILMDSNEVYNSGKVESDGLPHQVSNGVKVWSGFDRDHKGAASSLALGDDGMTMHEENPNFEKCPPDVTHSKTVKNTAQTASEANPNGISREEYVADALLFFLAGYETTSNTLSWISRTLAWYPDVQEKMRVEVLDSIENAAKRKSKNTQAPDLLEYDDIMNLKYMDQIIKEVMRLHPPLLIFNRVASEDYELGDIHIKKGTIINIPISALHRDAKIWESPEVFDPERFSTERSSEIHPFSYMPFGVGPRNCIGLRFALLEIKIVLSFILGSNIKFVTSPNDTKRDMSPENTVFRKSIINQPENGLHVGLSYHP